MIIFFKKSLNPSQMNTSHTSYDCYNSDEDNSMRTAFYASGIIVESFNSISIFSPHFETDTIVMHIRKHFISQ